MLFINITSSCACSRTPVCVVWWSWVWGGSICTLTVPLLLKFVAKASTAIPEWVSTILAVTPTTRRIFSTITNTYPTALDSAPLQLLKHCWTLSCTCTYWLNNLHNSFIVRVLSYFLISSSFKIISRRNLKNLVYQYFLIWAKMNTLNVNKRNNF